MLVLISQPQGGVTTGNYVAARTRAENKIMDLGYDIATINFTEDIRTASVAVTSADEKVRMKNQAVYYLAKQIRALSACDMIYFVRGWERDRGCQVLQKIAEEYGYTTIYE